MNHPSRLKFLPAAAVTVYLVAALGGCQSGAYDIRYELAVSEAVVEENAPEGGPTTDEIAVGAVWSATSEALSAHFTNPADTMAVIMWDGATISRRSGGTSPLVSTAPSAGPELPQSPTVIPRGGQVVVDMLARSGAEWEWFPNRAMGGFWKASEGIFGVTLTGDETPSERETLARSAVGEKVMVRIPVRTGRRVQTHTYDIRVSGAEVFVSYH